MDFKNISDGFTPDNNFNPNLQQQQPQLQTPPTKKKDKKRTSENTHESYSSLTPEAPSPGQSTRYSSIKKQTQMSIWMKCTK